MGTVYVIVNRQSPHFFFQVELAEMSFIESWFCLSIISKSAKEYFPAFKLFRKLFRETIDLEERQVSFIILLQNFGDIICKTEVSKIRKSAILLLEEMKEKLMTDTYFAFFLQILSKMRTSKNSIVSRKRLRIK